jgi:hypothetical protein
MQSSCCLCVYVPPPLNFMKSGMNIMAPEPILTVYLINPSHQSACLYVYVAGQQLSQILPQQQIHDQQLKNY